MAKIWQIDPLNPQPDVIQQAAHALLKGGLIVFPTQCIYGLAAHALNSQAIRKIFTLKKRPPQKPILILIENRADLNLLVETIPPPAEILMDRFWPGKVTIVFNAQSSVSELLTAGSGKIGIRLSAHPVANALIRKMKGPITGTSANLSAEGGCSQIETLNRQILYGVSGVLDAGVLTGGVGSTVIDVTGSSPRILREGTVAAADIQRLFRDR